MNTSKLLPAGVIAIALLGTSAMVAMAQTDVAPQTEAEAQMTQIDYRGERGGRDHAGHGERSHGHRGGAYGGEMLRSLIAEVDADGDNNITQDEIDAYRAAQIGAVDADGDGTLSIEEFDEIYRAFTRSRMVDLFQEFDADGDGEITAAEIDGPLERFVARMDRNNDGVVTLLQPGQSPDDVVVEDEETEESSEN